MTELGLILFINLAGLGFALFLARWLNARESGSAEIRRLGTAVDRAATSFLWSEYRQVAIIVAGVALTVLTVYGYLPRPGATLGGFEAAFWLAMGLILGAVCTCFVAHFAARLALHSSLRTIAAAGVSLDRAMTISVRAGGAVGLVVEALGVLGVVALFTLIYGMNGGFAASGVDARLAFEIATLLPGFALGTAAAALVLQRGGSIYHAAGDAGGDLTGEAGLGLNHDDPRNPAAVVDLVGDQVGSTAARSADLFVCTTVANVAAIAVGVALLGQQGLSLLALPLVIRAFGSIASAFGIMVVRTDEVQHPIYALWRGHATTLVVVLGGLAGAAIWLLPDHWWPLFSAGLLGVLVLAAASHFAQHRTARRFSPLRDVLDALRVGDTAAVAQGLAIGLQSAALPTLGVGLCMVAAWHFGQSSGVEHGGTLGVLTCLMAMLASSAYVLGIGIVGPITDSARGVLAMSHGEPDEALQRRATRLDEAGFIANAFARTYLIIVGCMAAILAALTLPHLSSALGAGAEGVAAAPDLVVPELVSPDMSLPVLAYSGALGAALLFAYAGNAMRAANRGVRAVAQEVDRQLKGFPRERGVLRVPADYAPSYRACIEAAGRASVSKGAIPVLAALALPPVLGIGLSVMYRAGQPGLALRGLSAFVVVAAATGLSAALAVDGTKTALGAARRFGRPRELGVSSGASVNADAVADLLGNAAGPAAHLFVKTAAISSLAIAPFLM